MANLLPSRFLYKAATRMGRKAPYTTFYLAIGCMAFDI